MSPRPLPTAAGGRGRGLAAGGWRDRVCQVGGARPRVGPSLGGGCPARRPPARPAGTMKRESQDAPPAPAAASPPLSPSGPPSPQDPQALWIFGYGSLVWRPDFAYSDSRVGFVRGYSRRFWQGDTFHRGSDKMPGRVVTLLEDHEGCTWGVAYQVRGEQVNEALKYLNVREAVLGGYDTKEVTFYPQETPEQPLKALAYVATPQNPGYLGPAPEEAIATQILACRGFAGHNLEYLLRLADFMQLCGPQAQDEHLAAIVDAVGTMLPCFCPTEQALALV
ncbi:glutathione-specific gamma-glutamylcyclotransferase 1 [Suncus etruscus]|uniref:glutathione-specific gamma-glutamylcyclotransferase 1 n=1 Tax=Suncus etruscus TaxID=109475 RepID=UPI00210FB5B6|nr:glutathione-specific gamma-glutamylcyclotransferase 1 [Suncus etruscus]